MAIRAVVFDIGGVLEITADLGVTDKWEQRLHLKAGELDEHMGSLWNDGSVGKCRREDVVRGLREHLGMEQGQRDEVLQDLWTEYLGQPNEETRRKNEKICFLVASGEGSVYDARFARSQRALHLLAKERDTKNN